MPASTTWPVSFHFDKVDMQHERKNHAIEGLRGLAAIMVVLSHIVLTFWPSLHSRTDCSACSPWQHAVLNSPLSFLYSGTFSVCVFFVMSGFVLSRTFFLTSDDAVIRQQFAKRYLRLAIPVLTCTLFVYALAVAGLFVKDPSVPSFLRGAFAFEPSIWSAIAQGTWQSFFLSDPQYSSYDPVIWTMRIEFIGSLLTFALCLFAKDFRYKPLLYCLVIAALLRTQGESGLYFALFVIGVWMASAARKPISDIFALALVIAGVFLGGYHEVSHFHGLISWLDFSTILPGLDAYHVANAIAGIAIFFAVVRNPRLAELAARFKLLGTLSFPVYLLHLPVLATAGMGCFVWLRAQGLGFSVSASAAIGITALLTGALSVAFHRYVDKRAVMLSRKFADACLNYDRQRSNSPSLAKFQLADRPPG